MSKFEKIFWLTIIILTVIFIILQTLATLNKSQSDAPKEALDSVIIGINLDKADNNISLNIKQEIASINSAIDINIDNIFASVQKNIDPFLDFHYSVVGEYIELGAMATDRINETIQKKLFGADFQNSVKEAFKKIDIKYDESINSHIQMIHESATLNIDYKLNNEILSRLENDISSFTSMQEGKLSLILGAKLIPKIAQAISTKIALKASSKFLLKSSTKAGAKYATTGTAALAGTTCGPFVWICSPLLAITAWFSTDAIVINIDEYYNRDEFKREILEVINEQKSILKDNAKLEYKHSFEELSKNIRLKYKNTAIKKLKIKEQF
ncbi:hypothetical protein Suden_0249 [Sulfurimonas denitrificans DSM 1251]|uniref:Uncharacterized protein n=2 Tax=Sulfurimonas denitrificans TaxID=39766 RepID=Q30U01_SULDN|nr:hypothetical protein Suden_0249 [Sulfurimonas denitrificans DSM 1251]